MYISANQPQVYPANSGVNIHELMINGLESATFKEDPSLVPSAAAKARVEKATNPGVQDTPEASRIRSDYRSHFRDGIEARKAALQTAGSLGAGTHHLENGDTVEVTQGEDGRCSVKTTHRNGHQETVKYDENRPNFVSLERDIEGGVEHIQVNGTHVTHSQRTWSSAALFGPMLSYNSESYNVDAQGRPQRKQTGPGGLFAETGPSTETVNSNGTVTTQETSSFYQLWQQNSPPPHTITIDGQEIPIDNLPSRYNALSRAGGGGGYVPPRVLAEA